MARKESKPATPKPTVKMTGGSGGGLGRMQKIKAYGKKSKG